MNKKAVTFIKMLCLTVALLFLLVQSGLVGKRDKGGQEASGAYAMYDFAMGTSFSLEIYGEDGKAVAQQCMDIVKDIDEKYLSRRTDTSELFIVNQSLQLDQTVEISDKLYTVLDKTNAVCEASNGAFDFTILPVSSLWNIEDADIDTFAVPEDYEIQVALQKIGYMHVDLSESDNAYVVSTNTSDMEFELGAVGKGYVLDELREYLQNLSSVTGAVIHAGGSVLVYGTKDDGTAWKIGVRDPKGNVDDIIGYLEYEAGTTICVSTSGDYEKYIEKDGIRYHHIIDAISGRPADAGLASVTVICEDGLYSDALSTACFILGYEKSLPLLKQFDAEAVFIDHDNHVVCTDGIANQYHSL